MKVSESARSRALSYSHSKRRKEKSVPTGACAQPASGSQLSIVHASLSSQSNKQHQKISFDYVVSLTGRKTEVLKHLQGVRPGYRLSGQANRGRPRPDKPKPGAGVWVGPGVGPGVCGEVKTKHPQKTSLAQLLLCDFRGGQLGVLDSFSR